MYQDPHLAAQSYGGAYSQPTLYQDLSGGMYAGAVRLLALCSGKCLRYCYSTYKHTLCRH